jgi:general secretion pathway protein B
MSFILDALRKSEHERQRSAMPGIAQVPFGLPRREVPRWAIAVIGLLALAVLGLGAAWWVSSAKPPPAELEAVAREPHAEVELAVPPPTIAAPPAAVYSAPPPAAPREERAASPASERAAIEPPRAAPARSAAAPARAETEVVASAAPANDEGADAEEPTLPSAAALAAEGISLPTLRLELHAYAQRPADRFVFINGTKYTEGATLAEGPRLVRIAPNGAVLVYLNRRFLLAPQ